MYFEKYIICILLCNTGEQLGFNSHSSTPAQIFILLCPDKALPMG
jgi:hypothetical protein